MVGNTNDGLRSQVNHGHDFVFGDNSFQQRQIAQIATDDGHMVQ
jgi:hypothetical protein